MLIFCHSLLYYFKSPWDIICKQFQENSKPCPLKVSESKWWICWSPARVSAACRLISAPWHCVDLSLNRPFEILKHCPFGILNKISFVYVKIRHCVSVAKFFPLILNVSIYCLSCRSQSFQCEDQRRCFCAGRSRCSSHVHPSSTFTRYNSCDNLLCKGEWLLSFLYFILILCFYTHLFPDPSIHESDDDWSDDGDIRALAQILTDQICWVIRNKRKCYTANYFS